MMDFLSRVAALFTGLCFAFAGVYGFHMLNHSEAFTFEKIHDTRDFVRMIDGSVVLFALFAAGVAEFFTYVGYALRFMAKHRVDTSPELNKSNIWFIFFLGMLSVVMYIVLPLAEESLRKMPPTP